MVLQAERADPEQARRVARLDRPLRNPLGGQLEIEGVDAHGAASKAKNARFGHSRRHPLSRTGPEGRGFNSHRN
jgi:hypothetical protein